jgi:hypothetical protein
MRQHSVESYVFSLVGTYTYPFEQDSFRKESKKDNNKEVANHDKDFDDGIGPTVETSI